MMCPDELSASPKDWIYAFKYKFVTLLVAFVINKF